MVRAAWITAFALSVTLHAVLAISFHVPSVGEVPNAASQPVSVAGSLAGILGTASPAAEPSAGQIEAVRAKSLEATLKRPDESNRKAKSLSARKPPLTARSSTARPVAAAQAPEASAVEQALPAGPVEPVRAEPAGGRAAPSVSARNVEAARVRQQRAASASKKAMSIFARKITVALARARPRRISGTGTVVIAFTLKSSGGLQSLSVRKSSGNAKIDRAAIRAVRRARFPKPPRGATRAQRSFLVPYYFRRR